MRISKDVVANLIKVVRAEVDGQDVPGTGQTLTVYYLDDLTLSFTQGEKPGFFGLTFEALGRDFFVIANLDLLVSVENDEGDPEAWMVDEPLLADGLSDYLTWRVSMLEKLHA